MIIDATPLGVYMKNIHEYRCDYKTDIDSLPTQTTRPNKCATGSVAFVIEDSSKWMLNGEGKWTKITASNTGGSSSGIDLDIATDEEVDTMLDDVFSK